MDQQHNFLLVDDSTLDLFINEKMLKVNQMAASIRKFLDPRDCLQFIQTENTYETFIILLDLQMPLMNGFGFVEAFQEFEPSMQKRYHIFMLSSTVDSGDIQKAKSMEGIIDILSKPLDPKMLKKLLVEAKLA